MKVRPTVILQDLVMPWGERTDLLKNTATTRSLARFLSLSFPSKESLLLNRWRLNQEQMTT
jgi:hypothetical protein